ncbi:putative E3 ubiquitin-protein ligase XBAT35 isoform X2 [Daucus carota subsp. sativus]|uniref:putative E3 ubiquitin-protein ligase XBAT35 isoform X2 n=1 Tax=Daucus carota subsp. sativus TaxID=79200 RepID=UPI0007EFBEBF|nr:PREDICTED: putative E3 ubiquitin-protein ligase XBAT35 isoform X2 [Daucus carota subsp. sativus]
MGQQPSKDELLYQQVNSGNIEGVRALRNDGAGLEWLDKELKTPLMVACLNPELRNVAKTLIELGANVNAYRPGRQAGTPLHHAAKRGLEQTVKLLLSSGANALVMNDDCQTPLDVARVKGWGNVVRAIEAHTCLFSGWMREFYGPGFLELLAPQLLTRKVWVVVLPCGSRNPLGPFRLELAIYTNPQDAKPRTIIALWKANLEELNLNQADPAVVISDISNKSRIKLAPAKIGDRHQLQWFSNACKGIPQVIHPTYPLPPKVPSVAGTGPSAAEDLELAMAISASLQPTMQDRPPNRVTLPAEDASTSSTNSTQIMYHNGSAAMETPAPHKGSNNESKLHEVGSSGTSSQHMDTEPDIPSVSHTTNETPDPVSAPSAPLITDAIIDDGPIHYPSIDFTPVDISSQDVKTPPTITAEMKEEAGTSSCVICLDAPVEGACIPCGHMAGCMSCLNEIKAKKWGCPVCRANIDQVIRLYAV